MEKDFTKLVRLLISVNDFLLDQESVTTILSRAQSVNAAVKREIIADYDELKLFVASQKSQIYPRHLLLDRLDIQLLDAVLLDMDLKKIAGWTPEQIIAEVNGKIVENKGTFKLNKVSNILEIIKKMQLVAKVNHAIDLVKYSDLAQKCYLQMAYWKNIKDSEIEGVLSELEESVRKVRFALGDEAKAKKMAIDLLSDKGFTAAQLEPFTALDLLELIKDMYFAGVATVFLRQKGKASYTSAEAVDMIALLLVDDEAINSWD
jgi:hypothetical protein